LTLILVVLSLRVERRGSFPPLILEDLLKESLFVLEV